MRNIGIALLNIFMVVSLVLILMLKNDYGYRLYWVITPFLMVLALLVIKDNPYIIVGFFIVMIIYEVFTYLSIYVAKRDTARLLEKKYNHKRK